jgi:hypothetical protein
LPSVVGAARALHDEEENDERQCSGDVQEEFLVEQGV